MIKLSKYLLKNNKNLGDKNTIIDQDGIKIIDNNNISISIKWKEIFGYIYHYNDGYILLNDKHFLKQVKVKYNRSDINTVFKNIAEKSNSLANIEFNDKYKENNKYVVALPLVLLLIIIIFVDISLKNITELIVFNSVMIILYLFIRFIEKLKSTQCIEITNNSIIIKRGFKILTLNNNEIIKIDFNFKCDDTGWKPKLLVNSLNYRELNILPLGVDPLILYANLCNRFNKSWA